MAGFIYTLPKYSSPFGYQQLTGISASVALTVPAGATWASIVVEAQGVRYRDDGVAPTASVGMPVSSGSQLIIYGVAEMTAIRFIQQTAGAVLNVSYYQ